VILSSCHALDFGVLHITGIINFLAAGWPISIGIAFVGRENVKNIQKTNEIGYCQGGEL